MLKSLKLHGVGPVQNLSASLGDRLNIITGDNGLGKSFLLDVCFWSLTGTWPGDRTAIPEGSSTAPTISYDIRSKTKTVPREVKYDFKSQTWSRQRGRPPMPGLVVYAAVDGGFAVWDPARNYWRDSTKGMQLPRAYQFSPESSAVYDEVGTGTTRLGDVANGLEEGGRVLCNGLIADWVEWFYQRSSKPAVNPFEYLEKVIGALSHPSEPLHCVEPRKVFVDDSRKFPVLQMPYGDVAYPHWSAGVKRIVNFAYLIVWTWVEHLQAAKLRQEEPANQIIVIVDEIEAHLHPRWQRSILPAILKVVETLGTDIGVQVLSATHSPLVLASLEPHFDENVDRCFCFNLSDGKVTFDNPPWAMHGDVVAWLTSDVFGLEQARSQEAERVIEAAEAFMRGDTAELPAEFQTQEQITDAMRNLLPGLDPFWPRWIVEAKL